MAWHLGGSQLTTAPATDPNGEGGLQVLRIRPLLICVTWACVKIDAAP